MGRILEPLRAMGVGIQGSEGDTAPLILQERPPRQSLLGREHYLAVASAQVKSCVLLAGLAADGPTTIIEPGPSRDHTERFLRSLGMTVQQECQVRSTTGDLENCYWTRLYPPETPDLPPLRITLPGDISSAAFLLVAGLLTPGSEITVENVVLNPTRTGLLEVLQAMGADLQVSIQGEMAGEPVGNITARSSLLNATRVEGAMVVRMIDEFPIFAVAAAFAIGETRVRNAEELRTKESDRIGSLCAEIRALGGQAQETPDGFVIQGNGDPLAGGRLDAHGDHRLAMAGMVAGLAAQGPVSVLGAEAFSESFPGFLQILRQMGGRVIDEQ
jgi:3-phosphoshikimate 1-carboxyvinyltransferase